MKKGLSFADISDKHTAVIDSDNAFWAILAKEKKSDLLLPQEIISLYQKMQRKLDLQMQKFRFDSELTAIYIDPTDRCNANCPYCYVPAKIRKNGREMTGKQLEYILQKIAAHFKNANKKPVIVFHASEPLLVKDIIFKAITKFKRLFRFGLQTNALLLEKTDVHFLIKKRVGVGISLDSHNLTINNRLRPSVKSGTLPDRDGNFRKAVEAIEWFAGYPGLNILTTVTKFNVRQLPDLVKFLHQKQVNCVLLNPVRLTAKSARNISPEENILTTYFIRAVDTAIELSRRSKRGIIIGNFANIILGIVAPTARRLMCDISPCGGGRCFLTITAKGDMIPCGEFIGLKGFSGGNIFSAPKGRDLASRRRRGSPMAAGGKNEIEQAMQSRPFKQIRSRFVEKIPECAICTWRNICGAPCPAELHSLGDMYQPAIFCEFYKTIIRYAFKLIAEKKEKYILRQGTSKILEYEYQIN